MRIGIDLGGTKIEGIVLNGVEEVARLRVPTPRSFAGTLDALHQLVMRLEERAGIPRTRATVGLGIPGSIVPDTGLVKNANSTWLNGRPLRDELETRLEQHVRVENDANCFALSEAIDGAGAGATVVFGVILGTGVGGGIVVNGTVMQGPNLLAGEWGHNPLPWPDADERPGPSCYCGKYGCIETWCCGPAFEREYAHASGQVAAAPDIVMRAMTGHAVARAVLDRYVTRLCKSLATVVNILDPDVIVLGGGMSRTSGLALSVKTGLDAWVFSDAQRTQVRSNVHGDSSGVRGAAFLWPQ